MIHNYKRKHRAQKLCVDCPGPVKPGRIRCESCLTKNNMTSIRYARNNPEKVSAIHKAKKARRAKNGRCVECSQPLDPDGDAGYKCCINCREHIRF